MLSLLFLIFDFFFPFINFYYISTLVAFILFSPLTEEKRLYGKCVRSYLNGKASLLFKFCSLVFFNTVPTIGAYQKKTACFALLCEAAVLTGTLENAPCRFINIFLLKYSAVPVLPLAVPPFNTSRKNECCNCSFFPYLSRLPFLYLSFYGLYN